MLQTKIIALTVTLTAGAVAPLSAQVDKPRPSGGNGPAERLPAPGKITAAQDSSGFIRVIWSAVEGAERYTLTRSVPPAGAAPVSLPNSADTVYIDRDVRPGSTYYYLVGAINQAGIMGLRASAPPVKAEDLTRHPVPSAPLDVRTAMNEGRVTLTWRPAGPDVLHYKLDRSELKESGPPSWIPLMDRDCCSLSDPLQGVAPGARVVYRVRAVSRWGDWSEPTVSNEVTTAAGAKSDSTAGGAPAGDGTAAPTRVLPAVVASPGKVRVGGPALRLGSVSMFTDLRLQKPRWVSLDEAIATVTTDGRVRGRSPGFTYIVATGVTPDGAVASMVTRIDVAAP